MATTPSNKPPERIKIATAAAALIARARAAVQMALDTLTVEQAAVKARIKVLEGVLVKQTAPAWCADLTEDATGEVATVEIPGEGKLVLIAPTARAPTAADGLLVAREAQTAPQVFFNAAILPGWQKYKPTYRRGIITALDNVADTADVTLTNDLSSAQGLGINVVSELRAVPVQYMSCNAAAFEVGDACVIEFVGQAWGAPRVVGFVSNPKPCALSDLHLIFWTSPGAMDPQAAVLSRGGSEQMQVNFSGDISEGGVYRSLGVHLESQRLRAGMELADTTSAQPQVRYELPAFYNGKPVLMRRVEAQSGTNDGQTASSVFDFTRTLQYGDTVLASGTYTGSSSSETSENGVMVYQAGQDNYSGFPEIRNLPEGQTPHPATIKNRGPWAAWSAVAVYITNGAYASEFNGISTTVSVDTVASAFTKYSLPAPKLTVALADTAQMPARLALDTPRVYSAAGIAGAPLDRHLLDFGYLPYQIDTLKVFAVCKSIVWAWLSDANGSWVNILALNYKTGAQVSVTAPEFFNDIPPPPGYMPKNVVLSEKWAALAENDPSGPYFWLRYYTLSMSAGLTLVKTITNRPGDLSAGGYTGLVQVSTPSLPAGSYLIGAMRDELGAM